MTFFERFGRKQQAPQYAESSRPLADFLGDATQSGLLGDMLLRDGNSDDAALARRLASKKLEPDDPGKLVEWQQIMGDRYAASVELTNSLTPALLLRFGKMKPDFAQMLMRVGGPDKTAQIFGRSALSLAVNHTEQFRNITFALRAYKAQEGVRAQALQATQKYGLNTEQYDRILMLANPSERKKEIERVVRGSLTGFEKFLNIASGTWYDHFRSKKVRKAIEREHQAVKDIESVLVGTVMENQELLTAFTDGIAGGTPIERRRLFSFNELRDLKFSPDAVRQAWIANDRSKDFHLSGAGALSDAQKETLRDEFLQQWLADSVDQYEARGGIWAEIAVERVQAFVEGFDKSTLDKRPPVPPASPRPAVPARPPRRGPPPGRRRP